MGKKKKENLAGKKKNALDTEQLNVEFGEMIPSQFGWIPPDEQKKKAEEHERL